MNYLISPFGFPPILGDSQHNDKVSTHSISLVFDNVFELLKKICEENLWVYDYIDENKLKQVRFFSLPCFYLNSGNRIRGLAELHLGLKLHFEYDSIILKPHLTNHYFFDIKDNVNNTPSIDFQNPINVATWIKTDVNEFSYSNIYASLYHIDNSKNILFKYFTYDDYIPLFNELGIKQLHDKYSVLSQIEEFLFFNKEPLLVSYRDSDLINAKILSIHLIARFFTIDSQIVCEYFERKGFKWKSNKLIDQKLFFSIVLNYIFKIIDHLIEKNEILISHKYNTTDNGRPEYSQYLESYPYDLNKTESNFVLSLIHELNYQPYEAEPNVDQFDSQEEGENLDYVAANNKLNFTDPENSNTIEFFEMDTLESESTNDFNFTIPVTKSKLNDTSLENRDSLSSILNSGVQDFDAKIGSKNKIIPDLFSFEDITETEHLEGLVEYIAEEGPSKNQLSNLVPIIEKSDSKPHEEDFLRSLSFEGFDDILFMDNIDENEDKLVKKILNTNEILSIDEKRKAVDLLLETSNIQLPFLPRLSSFAAWAILTKKWLHLLTFAETRSVLTSSLVNRSTYFDLMCLKKNILSKWDHLESGFIQHQYLKRISFEVFTIVFESWEYRQYLEDMPKKLSEAAVSISKVHYAYDVISEQIYEWDKLKKDERSGNYIDIYKLKNEIVLPSTRKERREELKNAFTFLNGCIEKSYSKVFVKPGDASLIFGITTVIFDLLVLNAHYSCFYDLDFQDDIFGVISEFKLDFYDSRNLDSANEDKFYVQGILMDLEPLVRKRLSIDEFLKF